jgi:hypothetical protein
MFNTRGSRSGNALHSYSGRDPFEFLHGHCSSKQILRITFEQAKIMSRDSSVGTAAGYGLYGRGSIAGEDKIFLFHSA